MAALTAAMLRPAGGPDPQYAAHQLIYESSEDSKSKRLWSPRLKFNSSASIISKLHDKSPDVPYMYSTISSPGGSALSKSMKYAETWLYGTVRHSPTQIRPSIFSSYPEVNGPVLISTPQKNPSPNYAVIICSCPEYLNGTKKSSSTKVSICKKCKGSRLPITIADGSRILVGGTLRGPQTSRDSNGLRAGTIKINHSKSRPSILSSKSKEGQDPYDLMRRTRLATPHEARISNNFATLRTRARSISPSRNRSRRASPASTDTSRKTRSKSVTRSQDAWTEKVSNRNVSEANSRRSILTCDLNPYELMKTKKNIRTKKDKDDTDDELNDICDENFTHISNHFYPNIHAIAGQRVKISDKAKSVVEELSVYDQIDINNDLVKAKHRYKTKELTPSAPLLDSKIESNKKKIQAPTNGSLRKSLPATTPLRNKVKSSMPKRPPRKYKPPTSEDDSESGNEKLQQVVCVPSVKLVENCTPPNLCSYNQISANGEAIKSILKKPRQNISITSDGEKSDIETPSPSQIRKVSGSQFYLPSPNNAKTLQSTVFQRKKVQFLVENDEVNILCSSERLDAPDQVFFGDGIHENNTCHTNNLDIEHMKNSLNITDEFLINEVQLDNEYEESNIQQIDEPVNEIIISESLTKSTDTINNILEIETLHEAKYDVETKSKIQNSTSVPRAVILRRSESERLPTISTVAPPKFLDSMALRPKTSKLHTSQVFLSSPNIFGVEKVKICLTENKIDEEEGPKNYIPHDITKESNSSVKPVLIDLTESPLYNSRKLKSPEPPPRMKTKEFKSFQEPRKLNYVKTRFVRSNSNSSTDDWCDTPNDVEQKTILKVSQSDCNTGDPYKVTIENDVDDSYESYNIEPRRTSILINGDDCYSTMNVSHDTPIYLSSVVVNDDYSTTTYQSGTTVTISVNSPEIQVNRSSSQVYIENFTTDEIEISEQKVTPPLEIYSPKSEKSKCDADKDLISPDSSSDCGVSSEEITELLKNPVEAVRRNLVPHVCGKAVIFENQENNDPKPGEEEIKNLSKMNFIGKLLEDPLLGHLAEGLESDLVIKLIENSLFRLKQTRNNQNFNGDRDEETMNRLIDVSLSKLRNNIESGSENEEDSKNDIDVNTEVQNKNKDTSEQCERQFSEENVENNCSAPYESMEYESGSIGAALDLEPMSDCYNASASELSTEDDTNSTRSKFYQMLVDATLCEIEISNTIDDDHHYESIRLNNDPIYEEISDMPPPLPSNPPPSILSGLDDDKKNNSRSIFEGASKYDILSYLVDAKERGIVPEDTYICSFENISEKSPVENPEKSIIHERQTSDLTDLSSRVSHLSNTSDSSEDNSLIIQNDSLEKIAVCKKSSAEIERNDSGVGSETSKSSRSRWQCQTSSNDTLIDNNSPMHLCEDCDSAVETQVTESGVMYAPLVCRKCAKKRAERKEIITEIVETEEKYGRDLQIILEEFYKPMLVAGLLTQEQLSAIFLNVEELLENNQALAEKLRDALEIAVEQGDEDLLTVNIGKVMLESAGMLHAFSAYCVRQGGAALLLASLEKDKELLRIFLRVSQMENAVLRRMNLNSFLMVPVQRVTKYPLLLTRLYKVTPGQAEGRELLKQAQHKIELHLSHMNAEAKDVSALRLWRRISSGGSGRRSSSEIDIINIKLRKMAVDVLEWNHDEARFAMEGKLLYTQPNDNNWRKGKTIKLTPINALLVTNGKPTSSYKPATMLSPSTPPAFPHSTGVREATLLLVKDKGGRYALLRDPLYLDRCVVAADADWDDYFEIHEITSKDTFIFKAEDSGRTRQWYAQLQYHAQGSGAWRKRRNALANIMINGMLARN